MSDRVTPDAVGRGERERFREALCAVPAHARLYVELGGGRYLLGSHSAPLLVRDLRAVLAALPPDAGGEDGERAVRERSEWETPIAVKLHTALCGSCPAFPGGDACEPLMCDCLCPHQDMTFAEFIDTCADELRAARRSATERSGGGN